MTNFGERILSIETSTDCDKWVWRSMFLTFCFRAFVDSERKSLASQAFGFAGAVGGPIFGDNTHDLSLAADDSVGKRRANHARRVTKWGLVLFRFVRHQSSNAEVTEIAEE
jgi:hypothetical protein